MINTAMGYVSWGIILRNRRKLDMIGWLDSRVAEIGIDCLDLGLSMILRMPIWPSSILLFIPTSPQITTSKVSLLMVRAQQFRKSTEISLFCVSFVEFGLACPSWIGCGCCTDGRTDRCSCSSGVAPPLSSQYSKRLQDNHITEQKKSSDFTTSSFVVLILAVQTFVSFHVFLLQTCRRISSIGI